MFMNTNDLGPAGAAAFARQRANHTGTQPIDTVEGLPEALDELNPQNNLDASAAPTANNDSTQGYSPLSIWIFEGVTYRCVDATPGAAVWIETGISAEDLGSAAFASTSDFDPAGAAAAAQAFARQRTNHTGTQGIETVSGLSDELADRVVAGTVGDESVTTSTGTQTVAVAMDRRGPVFDSVAALKAAAELTAGVKCRTLGYYEPGDGGGNDYEIVAAGTGTDDGGSHIDLAGSGLQARGLFGGWASVKQFGAGSLDDHAAINAALLSGLAVDFGSGQYVVKEPISVAMQSNLHIRSDGAKITLDSPQPIRTFVGFDTESASFFLSGSGLELDANNLAFRGFAITNIRDTIDESNNPTISADNLSVKNVYRSSTETSGGDGIYVSGGFNSTIFKNPRVEGVKAAVGAIIYGSQGAFGLTVGRNSSGETLSCTLENVYIKDVYSEDDGEAGDQDAIRYFSHYQRDGDSTPAKGTFNLSGTVINARGRSLKVQSQFANIANFKIIRDTDISNAVLPGQSATSDIDFQISGGNVSNLEFSYNGNYPREVVRLVTDRGDNTFLGTSVSNCTGFIAPNCDVQSIFRAEPNSASNTIAVHSVSGCRIYSESGGLKHFAWLNNTVGDGDMILNVDGSSATCQDHFFYTAGSGEMRITATSVHNIGGLGSIINSDVINRSVTALGCTGFPRDSNTRYSHGESAIRTSVIVPENSRATGVTRFPPSLSLAQGSQGVFPATGFGVGRHLLMISASTSRNAQAIFAVDRLGVEKITSGGGYFNDSSGDTEPSEETSIKIWSDLEGVKVKNNSISGNVVFTAIQLG